MNKTRFGLVFVLTASALYFWIRRSHEAGPPGTKRPVPKQITMSESKIPRGETPTAAQEIEHFPTVTNIKKLGLVRVDYVTGDYKLSEGLISLLELSSTQVDRANNALTSTFSAIKAEELRNSKKLVNTQGDEYIEISKFISEGKRISDSLRNSLTDILGSDAGSMIAGKLDKFKRFGDFGKNRREVYIEGELPNLKLTDYGYPESAQGNATSGMYEVIDSGNRELLKKRYGHLFPSL